MGTNFYLYFYSDKPEDMVPLHLGKQSCGWRFLFHKSKHIKNFQDFKDLIQKGCIMDEYEQIWSSDDLLKLIKSRQYDKQSPDSQVEHIDGCDFLDGDFV